MESLGLEEDKAKSSPDDDISIGSIGDRIYESGSISLISTKTSLSSSYT
jgi:hypothetical protein